MRRNTPEYTKCKALAEPASVQIAFSLRGPVAPRRPFPPPAPASQPTASRHPGSFKKVGSSRAPNVFLNEFVAARLRVAKLPISGIDCEILHVIFTDLSSKKK